MKDIDTILNIEGLEIPIKIPAKVVPNTTGIQFQLNYRWFNSMTKEEQQNLHEYIKGEMDDFAKRLNERCKEGWK